MSLTANPTLRRRFRIVSIQTDQYQDPWADLGLSLGSSTRDRHAYAGGNPVAGVDLDGHKVCFFKLCTTIDEKIAAVVDTTVKAATGDTSPTPVRSILPTGSVGPVSVTSPSVVMVSSQLTPVRGVSEQQRASAALGTVDGMPVMIGGTVLTGAGHVFEARTWTKFINAGPTHPIDMTAGNRTFDALARARGLRIIGKAAAPIGAGIDVYNTCHDGSTGEAGCKTRGAVRAGVNWSATAAMGATGVAVCGGPENPVAWGCGAITGTATAIYGPDVTNAYVDRTVNSVVTADDRMKRATGSWICDAAGVPAIACG